MKIGFIGLGIMGKPMAKNLIAAGHSLKVYDLHVDSVNEVVKHGAVAAISSADTAKDVEVVITMLPNSPHVYEVVCGENGVLTVAKPGTIIIDMSSIAPLKTKEISAECDKKGVRLLEAPVSGGETGAIEAILAIMVGGPKDLYDECLPLLKCMGSSVAYCGDIGAGNTTKLANQIIVAANIAAVAEAFSVAKKAGVDPNKVFEAIRGGLAGSRVMETKAPMMLANNTNPGFKINLHIKDLNNAIDTAHATGAYIPLTALIMEMMQNLRADGNGDMDHSALAKHYEKISKTNLF